MAIALIKRIVVFLRAATKSAEKEFHAIGDVFVRLSFHFHRLSERSPQAILDQWLVFLHVMPKQTFAVISKHLFLAERHILLIEMRIALTGLIKMIVNERHNRINQCLRPVHRHIDSEFSPIVLIVLIVPTHSIGILNDHKILGACLITTLTATQSRDHAYNR